MSKKIIRMKRFLALSLSTTMLVGTTVRATEVKLNHTTMLVSGRVMIPVDAIATILKHRLAETEYDKDMTRVDIYISKLDK